MLIKVLTLNIWRGEVFENALEFLKKEDPDIIFLQEVYDGKESNLPPTHRLFSVLKESFPDYSGVFGAAYCDITKHGNVECGNAILTKLKIISTQNIFFDRPYRTFDEQAQTSFQDNPQTLLLARLEVQGIIINASCVHGIWDLHGRDTKRRLSMIDTIIDRVRNEQNVILAGDFNLNPDTVAAQKIEKHLTSVFGTTLKTTFNMKHKKSPGFATSAVDMIFVSPNIRIINKKCPDVDVSDHLPLLATLEI